MCHYTFDLKSKLVLFDAPADGTSGLISSQLEAKTGLDSAGDTQDFLNLGTGIYRIQHHNGACGLSFADGHSEIHKWRGCLTGAPAKQVLAQDGVYLN